MLEELKALERNHTWSLVPYFPTYNIVGNKWVYKVKLNADGSFKDIMLVLIYVDDMIVTGNDSSSIQFFVEKLYKKFVLKDMGSLHHFLGIKVKMDNSGMYLTQSKYIDELLRRTQMEKTSPCPTSAIVGKQRRAEEGEPLQNPTIYQSTLGAL
ncbi:hypothetical protein UlMin_044432 [Ulmus minor]